MLGEAIVPASVRKLGGKSVVTLAEFQTTVRAIQAAHRELDELAWELREQGAPWTAIAWAAGLSVEGARRRWNVLPWPDESETGGDQGP